jgi:hypothetical protein
MTEQCQCEAVGQTEMARRLGMEPTSMRQLKLRSDKRRNGPQRGPWEPLPKARWGDRWCWPHQIVPWAVKTGRLPALSHPDTEKEQP